MSEYDYIRRKPFEILRFFFSILICCVLTMAVTYLVVIPVTQSLQMPDDIKLTQEEITNKQRISPNQFVKGIYDKDAMVDDEGKAWVDLKLFGFIKVKRIKVDVLPFDRAIAGGVPVGFSAKTNGVIVLTGGESHNTENGSRKARYKRGDVITNMDGVPITSVEDFEKHLDGKNMGLWVKDETSGVGMLTYINPANNNFAALGHKLVDFETGAGVNCRAGHVYLCNVIGVEKCRARKIGELKSTLRKGNGSVQGSVLSSNSRGVFGCFNEDSEFMELCRDNVYPVGSRYSVRPGKATILAALDGENIEEYDIEIIKTRVQKREQNKGLILRITDKRLLEKTGGIIHGMSGSPIIQNGKLVGALTHVMVGDYTKGYGIYVDFMVP